MICKGLGIFSRGNINPANIMVGSNIPINEINMAVCCDAVEFEMSKPSDNAVIINKALSANNKSMLP